MTAPSYTYTPANGGVVDASQLVQNFNDILNGVTDGTKDLSISALTCAGTATLNGNVTLGNATSDDITVTGSLAATLNIKTNNSFNIGSATLGLAGLYLGNGGVGATCKLVSASHATTRTYTVPDCSAAATFLMGTTVTSGVISNFQTGSYSSTFTWNGTGTPGTSSSLTLIYQRIGAWVTMKLPSIAATTGTTSITLTANTGISDSWAVPQASQSGVLQEMLNGGIVISNIGYWSLSTDGKLNVSLNGTGASAFSNGNTAGTNRPQTITYYVG